MNYSLKIYRPPENKLELPTKPPARVVVKTVETPKPTYLPPVTTQATTTTRTTTTTTTTTRWF
jgi:hypothetical protein